MSKANGSHKSSEAKVLEGHPPPWRPGPIAIGADGPGATIIDARGDVVAQLVALPGSNPGCVAAMLANSFDGGQSAKISDDLRCLILIGMNARAAGELLCSSFELMDSAEAQGKPAIETARSVEDVAGRVGPAAARVQQTKNEAVALQQRTEKAMRNIVLKALTLGMSIGALKPLAAGQFEYVPEAQ